MGARERHPGDDVARFGGTSLAMLERTYAHLLTSSAESARARLDAFAVEQQEEADERLGVTASPQPALREDESPALAGLSRGAPGKIRTCDLCLRRAALYPLSYGRGACEV